MYLYLEYLCNIFYHLFRRTAELKSWFTPACTLIEFQLTLLKSPFALGLLQPGTGGLRETVWLFLLLVPRPWPAKSTLSWELLSHVLISPCAKVQKMHRRKEFDLNKGEARVRSWEMGHLRKEPFKPWEGERGQIGYGSLGEDWDGK